MWELKRKIIYALVTFTVLSTIFVLTFRSTFFPDPTCFDGKKNGFEVNVDCGGTCALVCKEDVNPLTVVWAKAVKASKTSYDLVALVANTNIDNASRNIGYTFSLYDEAGSLMQTFTGSTTVPLDGKFPLIIQNVPLQKAPTNVVASLLDGPHYKVLESPTSPTIKILDRRYEAGSIPRIYATIANTKRIDIFNLPVRVLLFDSNDNVYAVGQTLIESLPKEGVQEIIITWNSPLPFSPTRIGVYPIFNPFEVKEK
jgi:hypothetical protein